MQLTQRLTEYISALNKLVLRQRMSETLTAEFHQAATVDQQQQQRL